MLPPVWGPDLTLTELSSFSGEQVGSNPSSSVSTIFILDLYVENTFQLIAPDVMVAKYFEK
jgi:hypothetical protein